MAEKGGYIIAAARSIWLASTALVMHPSFMPMIYFDMGIHLD